MRVRVKDRVQAVQTGAKHLLAELEKARAINPETKRPNDLAIAISHSGESRIREALPQAHESLRRTYAAVASNPAGRSDKGLSS